MCVVHKSVGAAVLGVVLMAPSIPLALGQPQELSIHEIQSHTSDGDASIYNGQIVDCAGGIVVASLDRAVPRLILQDPACPDGWGAIQVKDRFGANAFDGVEAGDWVSLTNVEVEEYRGTTFLQWDEDFDPSLTITSNGVPPLPPPIVVSVSDIPAPIATNGGWFVENHDAEPYESMRLIVRDVTVMEWGLGKAEDNYNLQNPQGANCWAADYLNAEKEHPWDLYHPFVAVDQHFCAVTGILEQYTKSLTLFDYYQILTLNWGDLAICGDGDSDGGADLDDLPRFEECLIGPGCDEEPEGCDPPAWTEPPAGLDIQHCLMMDQNYDGDVDLGDFGDFQMLLGDPQPRMRKEKRSDG